MRRGRCGTPQAAITTAGISVATVPVFDMKADRMAVPAIITTSSRSALPRALAINALQPRP